MEIFSFGHRGLRRLFERDETRGLPAEMVERIRRILFAMDNAESMDELGTVPGWRLHRLRGDRRDTWSISVSGNWRITFRVDGDGVHDLDLEDYH